MKPTNNKTGRLSIRGRQIGSSLCTLHSHFSSMNGCATLEEGGRAGHKSRQLKKSCWPFKTSSHRHKRKRRYYIGERCLNIFSRSLLSPSLHPPSYFSIYILFSSLFSLFQRHSWRKRRGEGEVEGEASISLRNRLVGMQGESARKLKKMTRWRSTRHIRNEGRHSSLSANPPLP